MGSDLSHLIVYMMVEVDNTDYVCDYAVELNKDLMGKSKDAALEQSLKRVGLRG